MARRKGERWPSDARRWFRVMEDILHHPKVVAAGHDGLATFVKLLAVANQRKAQDAGGLLELDKSAQHLVTGRHRADSARTSLRCLADVGLISLNYRGDIAVITIRNYADKQGFAPSIPQSRPDKPPATKTTPTPTTKKRAALRASRSRSSGPKASMPEPYPAESREQLIAWAMQQAIPPRDLDHAGWLIDSAIGAVLRWATMQDVKRTGRGWDQTIRNAITDKWDRVNDRPPQKGPAAASRSSSEWQAERAALHAQIDAEAEERERRFPTVMAAEEHRPGADEVKVWPASLCDPENEGNQ